MPAGVAPKLNPGKPLHASVEVRNWSIQPVFETQHRHKVQVALPKKK